jgi:hypothetical protein
MLIRDGLGYVHDVPDSRLYGFQHVGYDGLGNPVGFAFLAPLLEALPSIASAVLPAIGNLFGGGKKGDGPPPPAEAALPPPEHAALAPPPMAPCPPCPVCPVCGAPAAVEPPMLVMPPPGMPPEMQPMPPMPVPGARFVPVRHRRRFHARPR